MFSNWSSVRQLEMRTTRMDPQSVTALLRRSESGKGELRAVCKSVTTLRGYVAPARKYDARPSALDRFNASAR
jgi:hypothetical protein